MGYFLGYSWGILGLANHQMSFGVLVVFLQLFNQIQGLLAGIAGSIPKMTYCFASAERIMELENMKPDEYGDHPTIPLKLAIFLDNVCFSYAGRNKQLTNVNLYIKPGELVLLMGKSGSGKTTLIRLLLSLIGPEAGNIVFKDQTGLKTCADAGTRKWLAYVPQGNSLFSGTIAANGI